MAKNNLLLGLWRHLFPIPRPIWQKQVLSNARHNDARLSFMRPEHHQVRDFVVRELPRVGQPLPPDWIAQQLNLPIAQVNSLLDDLEQHMTFLYRNEAGAVVWAYPVTAAHTPHHLTFSTGERIDAA